MSTSFRRSRRRESIVTSNIYDNLELNKLRLSSMRLYGREMEVSLLQKEFNRVCQRCKASLSFPNEHTEQSVCRTTPHMKADEGLLQTSPELILLSGRSGTGKSALAQSLKGYVERSGGIFAMGKFDMRKQSEPYTAFVLAFNELCNHVMSTEASPATLDMRSCLHTAIGSEIEFMTELVPNISQLLGEQEKSNAKNDLTNHGYCETKNKFNFLLRKFLCAFSSKKPLVLFLDDLQWADKASLELFKTLVLDESNLNILFIGSYRDDELERNISLATCLRDIKLQNHMAVSTISLGNLDEETINMLLADILTTTGEKTSGLAQIVHSKTHGNVFAVIQFLNNMQLEGILYFCIGTLMWKWDEDEVQSDMYVTENVAEMMIFKLKNTLSPDVRNILQIGACLGGQFDPSTLSFIAERLQATKNEASLTGQELSSMHDSSTCGKQRISVIQCLNHCLGQGLLECHDGLNYQFTHDQVSAAAFSLIPQEKRDYLQLRIGQALLEKLSDIELERKIFIVVDLLNRGVSFISRDNDKECKLLATLNLKASRKAMRSSAFTSAESYIKIGISLLGPEHWSCQTALSLEMFDTAAKIALCNRNWNDMKYYLNEIICQNLPTENKVSAYIVKMNYFFYHQHFPQEGRDIALDALSKFGVIFPKKHIKCALIKELIKTKFFLRGKCISKIRDHFVMEDERKMCIMQLMESLVIYTNSTNPTLSFLVNLKMVQWSVCHGISRYSAVAFSVYGLFLCGIMGNIAEGYECAKVAKAIVEEFNGIPESVFGCNAYINHWVEPIHIVEKRFRQDYDVLMRTGNISVALASRRISNQMSLSSGRPLASIEADTAITSRELEEHNNERLRNLLLPMWQFVLNLMGQSNDPQILTGKVMQQDDLLRKSEENKDYLLKSTINFHQIWAAFYFGDLEYAGALVKDIQNIQSTNVGSFLVWRCALFDGLTAFALARKHQSYKWKKHAAKVTSKVRRWVEKGNVNCKHILFMFEGEMAALKGKNETVREKYSAAISTAARFGFIHDRALANELFGIHMLEIGETYFAAHCLKSACELYSRWGATAKEKHLSDKYKWFLDDKRNFLANRGGTEI